MKRNLLVAGAAAAPLLIALGAPALAETTITTAVTTPAKTSTVKNGAPDDLRITSAGSVKPTAAGAAVTMDSNNKVTNEGAISFNGVDGATGVLANGGLTGDILNKGSISLVEDYTAEDTDKDGDLDGPFAKGANRYGIHVSGSDPFTGSITNDGGSITIEGNNSAGIWVQPGLIGSLINKGSISVTGDNSYGVRVQGPVTGAVTLNGSTAVLGQGSVAVALEDDVSGRVTIQGAVSATGYRYTTRPSTKEVRDKLDADDLKQGGSAVVIAGNVGGGILLDAPPPNLDPNKDDEDNDGVPDASEGTAAISVSGSAPALRIGSATEAVTIGAVGTGDNAYALINKGGITASGVYDGASATGVLIGGQGGATTTLTGGIRSTGSIGAVAYEADAAALKLGSGAVVDRIVNSGTISGGTVSEGVFTGAGIQIGAGATVGSIKNSGTITAFVSGEKANAVAIQDLSGTLTLFENTGKVTSSIAPTDDAQDTDDADNDPSNEVITGKAIAIDNRTSSTGLRIVQTGVNDGDDGGDNVADPDADGDGVDDADEPSITGAILLGSGNDRLELLNGTLNGDMSFGAGDNTLIVDGTGVARGAVTATGGTLAVTVGGSLAADSKGTLNITNTGEINGASLNVGSKGTLIVTVDPSSGATTHFTVGSANFASGAQIGLNLKSLLPNLGAEDRFVIVDAGTLIAGTFDQTLLGNAPYLYIAQAGADTAAGQVYVDVRRRTAAEAGLIKSETAAYDAVYNALGKDDGIRDAFLGQTTREGFLSLYDQMMPNQGEGIVESLDGASQLIAQATSTSPSTGERYGGDSVWLQEINQKVERDREQTLGGSATTFGLAGGYESMTASGGALGVSLAYVSVEEEDEAASLGEKLTANLFEGGVYWRQEYGRLRLGARAAGGYGWFDSTRKFVLPGAGGVTRTAKADWTGWYGTAHGFAAYEQNFGAYYLRPEVGVDYLYLREGAHTESGGGDGFDLAVEERTSDRLSANAQLTFGRQFGDRNWVRPEIYVGYRQIVAGQIGDTVASFAGGDPFTLVANDGDKGWASAGFTISAGTPLAYVGLQGNADLKSKRQRYSLRILGRAMF